MAKSKNGREAQSRGRDDERDKKQSLDLALSQIEKQYGKGAIMRMGEEGGIVEAEAITSGSLSLDIALGIGGFPPGPIVEISGPEGARQRMGGLHARP